MGRETVERKISAVPTFTVFEYFAHEPGSHAEFEMQLLEYKIKEFKKQIAADIPFAVGSM